MGRTISMALRGLRFSRSVARQLLPNLETRTVKCMQGMVVAVLLVIQGMVGMNVKEDGMVQVGSRLKIKTEVNNKTLAKMTAALKGRRRQPESGSKQRSKSAGIISICYLGES